jgi:hypothetical protein
MRHFVVARAVATLSLRMSARPAQGVLIASAGAAQALAACQPRALPGAVDVAVIATRADLHLYPAAAAVVEPVSRLLEQPQAPPPDGTGQRRGGEA